jgi:hypothetical protein
VAELRPTRREFLFTALAGPFVGTAGAFTQVEITEELFHGRHAIVLQNSLMRLAVLPGGGFIAEASLKSRDPSTSINPMRVPYYDTIDPYTYDVTKDGARYGTGMQRRLMSGYMGHFTCFPHFGEVSRAEFAQDYGQHGELIAVKWQRLQASSSQLAMRAELPITQFGFQRTIVLLPDETVCYVTETATNLVRYDRPIQWVQHSAFGPPFASPQTMFADASASSVVLGRAGAFGLTTWPIGEDPSGHAVDVRPFSGRTSIWLVNQTKSRAWLTAYSTQHKVLLGYIWDSGPNPWLLDFQEDRTITETPWDGKTVMRGLCFGDSATSGLRDAVTQGSSFGRPTYSWIEARGTRSFGYILFLVEIPLGFKGVSRLSTQGGRIKIVERETERTFSVKSSLIA